MADRQRDFPHANRRAGRLRSEATPAEKRLWQLLRKLENFHFRRQPALGPYVFDFADLGRKIVIELDGDIHALPEVQERDRVRQMWVESQGFLMVRIPNQYVFGTGELAIAMVMAAGRLSRSHGGGC